MTSLRTVAYALMIDLRLPPQGRGVGSSDLAVASSHLISMSSGATSIASSAVCLAARTVLVAAPGVGRVVVFSPI